MHAPQNHKTSVSGGGENDPYLVPRLTSPPGSCIPPSDQHLAGSNSNCTVRPADQQEHFKNQQSKLDDSFKDYHATVFLYYQCTLRHYILLVLLWPL